MTALAGYYWLWLALACSGLLWFALIGKSELWLALAGYGWLWLALAGSAGTLKLFFDIQWNMHGKRNPGQLCSKGGLPRAGLNRENFGSRSTPRQPMEYAWQMNPGQPWFHWWSDAPAPPPLVRWYHITPCGPRWAEMTIGGPRWPHRRILHRS